MQQVALFQNLVESFSVYFLLNLQKFNVVNTINLEGRKCYKSYHCLVEFCLRKQQSLLLQWKDNGRQSKWPQKFRGLEGRIVSHSHVLETGRRFQRFQPVLMSFGTFLVSGKWRLASGFSMQLLHSFSIKFTISGKGSGVLHLLFLVILFKHVQHGRERKLIQIVDLHWRLLSTLGPPFSLSNLNWTTGKNFPLTLNSAEYQKVQVE